MGKLILTSGGYLDGQRGDHCDKIIEKYSKNKNVLIVDNATLTGCNVKRLSIIYKNFSQIAHRVVQVSLTEHNLELFKGFDIIYITGGDLAPFVLLMQKCNLAEEMLLFLKGGGVVIGESAGSIIFGKSFKWLYDIKRGTKPKYDTELLSYKGLGIVDINFFPHWNKASDEIKQKVLNYEQKHNVRIARVKDGEFFEIDV